MRTRQPDLRVRSWREWDKPATIACWDALAKAALEPNPFFESWYLLPALKALDPDGEAKLLTLELSGQLIGLMPIVRQSRYYGHPMPHWAVWVHANCFCGQPLVMKGYESLFWQTALAWFDKNARREMFLHLSHCPTDGALHAALKGQLAQDRRGGATVLREERAMLRTSLSPEAYLAASLSTKKRKELRRQHRRLAEEGELTVERIRSARQVNQWANEFIALEMSGWKGKAGSALGCDARTARLFTQALAGAAQRGKLERLAIRLDSKPVAMLASFIAQPGAFSFKTAFDESYARFSPGVLLQRENLELASEGEIIWIDSCAAPDHAMIDHFWRERREIARHSIAIGGGLRRAAFALISKHESGAFPGGIL